MAVPARRASSSASCTSAGSNGGLPAVLASVSVPRAPPAGAERRDDDRAQLEAADERELLGIADSGEQHLLGDLPDVCGLPGARHEGGPAVWIGRVALVELLAEPALVGVDVLRGDLVQLATVVEDAYPTPVRDVGDGDPRNARSVCS